MFCAEKIKGHRLFLTVEICTMCLGFYFKIADSFLSHVSGIISRFDTQSGRDLTVTFACDPIPNVNM